MKREVKIGLFAIVIICCSWAGIRFLSGIDIFSRNVEYYAHYDKISGISSASPILIQGVKVGKVTEIVLNPSQSDKVVLKLSLKRQYQIPNNSVAKIYSPGLMSSMAIGIDLGDSPIMLEKGDTIATEEEINLMDVASEKLMDVTTQIAEISEELTKTLRSVNGLLDESGDNINATIANLNSISGRLSRLLATQSANIENAVEGISQLSTTLGENSENIDQVINNLNALSEELAQAEIGTSLGATLAELNTTLGKINSAEGSAGKLLNDEELYENLSAVSGSLNELIIDMQSNPKRYVHFSLFGSKNKE